MSKKTSFKDFSKNIEKYQIIKSKGQFMDGGSYTEECDAYYIKKGNSLVPNYKDMFKALPTLLMIIIGICALFSMVSFISNSISYFTVFMFSIPTAIISTCFTIFRREEFKLFFRTQKEAEKYISEKVKDTKTVLDNGEVVKEVIINNN